MISTQRFFKISPSAMMLGLLLIFTTAMYGQSVPTITGFSSNRVDPGTTITISGTGFSTSASDNIVFFGPKKANVSASTTTQMTVDVPNGAGTGLIRYTNLSTGLTTVSKEYFIATNASLSGKNLSEVSLTPGTSVSAVTGNGTWHERGVIIAAEDFDGDGKTDILKGGTSNSFVVVRNTNSTPGSIVAADFASPFSVTTTGNVTEVATGDLDGDGKIDVVTASTGGTVTAILNNSTSGNLSFGESNGGANDADFQTVYAQYEAYRVSLADVDVDGKLDLVVMGRYSSKFYVFLNTSTIGNLSFNSTPIQINPSGMSGARQMSVGDVNMDGKVDVLIGMDSGSKFTVCLNTSTGAGNVAFASTFNLSGGGSGRASVVDVNGDGKNDVVGDGEAVFINGDSDGTYTSSDFTRIDDIIQDFDAFTPFADLNGDGKVDFIGDGGWSYGRLSQNNSTTSATSTSSFLQHSFSLSITYMESIVLVDLDDDNKVDYVASSGSNANVEVKRNRVGETISVYPKDNSPNYNEWYETLTPLGGNAPNSAVDIPEFEFNWSNPSYSTLNWYYSSTFEGSHVFSNTIVALSSDLKINGPMTGYSSSAYVKTSSSNGLVRPVASSEVEFPVGGSTYGLVRVTNQNSTSDVFEVNAFDGVYQSGGTYGTKGYNTIDRTWIVNKASANGSGGVDLSFNWDINDNVNGTVTTPALYTFDGSSWTKVTNNVTTTGTSITVSGYTGTLSSRKFAIGDDSYGFVAPPSISSYSAYSGPSGHSFYISGSGFTGVTSVTIGGDPVSSFTVDSDTKISIVAGSGTTGQIQAISGAGTATGSRTFTFNPSITITGSVGAIDKCSNQASANQTVNVSGQNLINALWVNSATGLEYSSDGGSTWTTVLAFTPTSGVVNKDVEIRAKSNQNSALSTRSVVVSSASATSQNISYSVGILPNTMISTQPSDESTCINSTETISVTASGSGLTYQWFSNTTNSNTGGTSLGAADGAQTSTLTVSTSTAGTTYYYCEVSGTCGDVTSDVSEVAVYPASVAGTASAANTTLCPGNPAVLTLSGASGDIQWQSSADNSTWSDITGATSASYTSPNLQDDMYYRAVSTSGCDASTSNVVTISVSGPAPYLYDRTVNFSSSHYLYSAPTTTLNLDGSSSFTVEAWINPTDFSNSSAGIVSKGNAFSLKTESNGRLSFIVEQSWSWERLASSDNAITLNEWQHVAASYDGSTREMKLYIDGQLVGSMTRAQSFTPNFTSSNFQIGRNISGNGGYSRDFNGNIDEVKLWNVVKSDADISNDYATQLTGSESNLMAYYTFDQGEGGADNSGLTGITDISGNGNDLSFSSGMTLDGSSSNIIQTGPAILGDNAVCLGSTVSLTHTISGGTWSSSNSSILTITSSGAITGVAAGSSTVSYDYSFNGCNYTSTKLITVNSLPVQPVVSDVAVCLGEQVDLGTASTALTAHTLSWSTAGNSATTTVPNYTSTSDGVTTYSVYQTDDATSCVSPAASQVVTVHALPSAPVVTDVAVCEGETVNLSNAVTVLSGHVASWGSTAIENTSAPVGQTLSTGIYTIGQSFTPVNPINLTALSFYATRANYSATLTVTLYQGDGYTGTVLATETLSNTLSGEVKVELSNAVSLTANQIYTFKIETNTSNSHTISWNSNGNPYNGGSYWRYGSKFSTSDIWFKVYSNTTTAPNYSSTSAGSIDYNVYQTNTTTGCISPVSIQTVTTHPLPVITGDAQVQAGEQITLTATTTAASSNAWVSSDAAVATVDASGVVTGQSIGTATITYTNENGCTEDHALSVIVGTTQTPTLTSPASNITGATTFAVTYTLAETPLSGSVKLTFSPTDGGTPIVWTMGDATSVSFNYDVNTTPSNAAISSGALLPYDTYDVELSYQDAYSNPAATATNTNIQTLAPPAISYSPANYAYVLGASVTTVTPANTGGVVASWSVSPSLPAGITFSTSTGEISGTASTLAATTTYTVTATNLSGTSTADVIIVVDNDTDGDGIPDEADVDVDGDGVNDNGTDTDGDGINNTFDDDIDGDGIPNDTDPDIDGDGIPNGSDVDPDGDGVNDNGTDTDGDGVNDANDTDIDGDGIANGSDACPTIINTAITSQPSSSSEDICPSGTLSTLSVTAVGENLTYQWYVNNVGGNSTGTAVAGATSATYAPASLVGPSYYYVEVSGDCGVLNSSASGAMYARDIIAPTVVAITSFTAELDANGSYTITESDIITSKSDNCTSVPTISLTDAVYGCSDAGVAGLTVTWTATDDEGNVSTGSVPVTVVDLLDPIMAVQNVTVQMDASGNSSVSTSQVDDGTTDNCSFGVSFDAASAVATLNFVAADLGANTVTLYATDASNNQSSSTATVTVVDQISPVVNTQNVTVYLDANGAASITTSDIDNGTTDNSGQFTLTLDNTSFDCDDLGTNTVVLTATDVSGNTSNSNATVTVVDNTIPVLNITNSYAILGADGTVTLTQNDISGTVIDNCDVTWTFSTATFDCSMLGANIITVTATDASGNTTNDEIVVTIADNTAPVVALQPVTLTLDANGTATLDTAVVIDYVRENCSVSSMSLSQTTFNCSDLGANTITLTVIDSEGNSTAQTATVTVTDAAAPVASTQDITLALDANGAASMSYLDIEDGSTDNCGIESYSIDATNFTCADLGVNWVVLSVTDAAGNTDTAWSRVTVVDQLDPVALVQPFTVALDASGAASISASDVNAGSYDNCSGVSVAIDVTSFTCADLGANTVTLTATDASGNATSVATIVTVVDNTAPVVALQPVTLTLDANGTATLDTAAVIDYVRENCSVSSMSLSQTTFNCSDLGANTITLTVMDSEGNSTAQTATVTVTDAAAPVAATQDITLALDANGAASMSYLDVEDGSTDNCGIESYAIDATNFTCADLGVNWVVLSVTDAAGNTDTAWSRVTVVDQLDPVALVQPFTVALDASGAASISASDVNAGSYDNCSGVSVAIDVTSFTCADLGANTVTLTATDASGNATSVATTVTVVDNTAPVVALQPVTLTLDANGTATLDTAMVIDYVRENCSVSSMSLSQTMFNCSDLGANTITLTVMDSEGNSTAQTATVMVTDAAAPTILMPSMLTVYANALCQATATWSTSVMDNCSASWSSNYASGSTFGVGQHDVITTATDASGNTTVDTMLVSVIDTVAPIFTSQPFVSSMVPGPGCSAYVTWVNPMAVDWCSSNSVSSNVLSGSLFTSGTHTVVFTATDDNQNTRSMTLTFTVNDGVAPVATVPSTVIATNDPGTCGAVVNLPIPSGTDNCGVDTAYYSVASGSVFPVGITPVTITVIDFDGNMDQGVFNVEVQDTEKPVFTNVPTDTVLGYCNSALAYSLPSATDNCGISSVNLISGIAPGNIFPAGQTKNIFQVTDVHGNSDTVSFTVFVSNQSTAPTPMFGSICENESPFDLRQGDTSYAFWGDYIDDNIFDPGLAGAGNTMVYYSWTDSLGCTSLGQLNLFIDAAPDLPIVQRSSSTYLTVNMAYARYQWLKNGIAIPGATNRDFIVTSSGYYRVKVWNAAGCDETSAPLPVGTVGLDEAVLSDITIYPNPSTGQFNLDLTKIQSEVQVAIYDGVGKQVYRGSAKNELVQIDLSDLASGMYHIVLRDAEGASVTKRVSIQK